MPLPTWKLALTPLALIGLASPLRELHREAASRRRAVPSGERPAHRRRGLRRDEDRKFDRRPHHGPARTQARIRCLLGERHRLSRRRRPRGRADGACRRRRPGRGRLRRGAEMRARDGHGAEKVAPSPPPRRRRNPRRRQGRQGHHPGRVDRPLCFTDVGTIKQCLVDCGQEVKGDDKASCTGGELYGTCKGRCGGACADDPGPASGRAGACAPASATRISPRHVRGQVQRHLQRPQPGRAPSAASASATAAAATRPTASAAASARPPALGSRAARPLQVRRHLHRHLRRRGRPAGLLRRLHPPGHRPLAWRPAPRHRAHASVATRRSCASPSRAASPEADCRSS